jgi:hypothetical protein
MEKINRKIIIDGKKYSIKTQFLTDKNFDSKEIDSDIKLLIKCKSFEEILIRFYGKKKICLSYNDGKKEHETKCIIIG